MRDRQTKQLQKRNIVEEPYILPNYDLGQAFGLFVRLRHAVYTKWVGL